ncbi:adenylate/guanylate cyclase domain-containing protein [Solimonas marina]|uniref:AAA family ATPase n=1 Tax=Solimonas marina TaxID=2714601 RepID=A0A969WBW6_9GAMM|nr:adenylate/guanylate cyclase domain-containing protein [Solimonas marina]NKF23713.1 AAA family ATPase [Solimonas marina]
MKACTSCHAQNAVDARYCNQCGTRLGDDGAAPAVAAYTPPHLRDGALRSAGIAGERKQVTVLFADIKGSTRLAEQAGAERWHAVLDRVFTLLGQAVHRYDGTINQYTGDGVMALFGAPLALEDHALHAALAALDMQQLVRRYADDLRLAHGLNLSMRIGLNSGEVVVGRIGDDLRQDYTAQGPTVHLAARLESLCEPGRVYVSQASARQLEGYCRLRALGAAQLPGYDQPQAVFELEAVERSPARLRRSLARSDSPFLGRQHEFERLRAALQAVSDGRGRVLAVVGDAGLGKSRLCHEFTEQCARDGIVVHRCSAVPYARRVPLLPVRELLRSRLGVPATADDAQARQWIAGALALEGSEAVQMLPQVLEFLGIAEAPLRGAVEAPADLQARMLDLLAEYLCCGPRKVLLVEDLHFLDPATEAFLERLAQAARRASCLLLLNYRPQAVLARIEVDETLRLRALDDADLRALASTLLGPHPSLQAIVDTLVTRAAGHPYFVEEAVLALADGGWLQGTPRAWTLGRALDAWPLPDSVQALLAARIDRLAPALRALLQTAAVIGQQFDAALLAAAAREDLHAVEAQLQALADAGLVRAEADHWSFVHPLLQDVAYRTQLDVARRAVHATLAGLLERRHGAADAPHEVSEQPCEAATAIAYHWRRAGEMARAGRWGLHAAQWMQARNFDTATELCRTAIADLDRAGDDLQVRAAGVRGRAMLIRLSQFSAVDDDEIERAYRDAQSLAATDAAGQIELQLSYGNRQLYLGRADAAAQIHEQAVTRAMASGQAALINRFRLTVLMSFHGAGRLRQVLTLLDRAGDDWRSRPVDAENYMSRAYYGMMIGWMGQLDAARTHLRDAMQVAAVENGRAMSWMHQGLVDLALLSGEFSAALPAAETGMRIAADAGSPFLRALALRAYGLALALDEQCDEAVDALREALPATAPGALAHAYQAPTLATLALVEQLSEHDAVARQLAQQACHSARAAGSRVWEILALLVWLRGVGDSASRDEIGTALQRVRELLDFTGADGLRPWLSLAEAQHDPANAAALAERARAGFVAIGAQAYAEQPPFAHWPAVSGGADVPA